MTFSMDLGKAGRQRSQNLPCALCSTSTEEWENIYILMVFADLETAYDTVPRDLIWWLLRKKGIPEKYVAIIQDMYHDTTTKVKTCYDTTY